MWKWSSIDATGIEWLRDHPDTIISLDRSWADWLRRQLDFRPAGVWAKTKFGHPIREMRELRRQQSVHIREFNDHVEIHTDAWNPDWSPATFVYHLAQETPAFQIAFAVTLTAAALRFVLS